MISQKFRFHGHNSLKYVFQHGQSERNRHLAIKWTENKRRRHPRLSVVVSKKVFKSAVKRNRIRRRIYESARPLLIDAAAIDAVISVYSGEVLDMSHDELTIEILPLLNSAGLKSTKIHE
ncbi:ribonuclease P protein component [Candidatus Saccharibacteria bacterium]|nr:MAG: ribonuclease P protein component [Candidatus Saccharibacteria bacterium]